MSRGERFDVKIADIANRVLSINIPALLFTKIVLEENSRENCPIRPIKKKKKKKRYKFRLRRIQEFHETRTNERTFDPTLLPELTGKRNTTPHRIPAATNRKENGSAHFYENACT